MKSACRFLIVLAVLFLLAPGLYAQAAAPSVPVGVGAGIGMGLSIVGLGIGLGIIGYAALSGIARQPEQAGNISGTMILLAALVEGAAIISLILCFVLTVL